MIVLDTSVLVESLTGPRRFAPNLRLEIERSERILIPALVLYEWLRGPRLPAELTAQERLFPADSAISFGPREAEVAASIYRSVRRPRGRELDIAIAACSIVRNAELWTLNHADFRDIPDLRLKGAETR